MLLKNKLLLSKQFKQPKTANLGNLAEDPYLTTTGGHWYFSYSKAQNQSLYHKIQLLQKFSDFWGKVLRTQKNQPPT